MIRLATAALSFVVISFASFALIQPTLAQQSTTPLQSATPWQAGFAKVDVTPKFPVRLSGYGNRDRPSEGVQTKLHVRTLALKHGDEPVHVMVSIDSIGLGGEMTSRIAATLQNESKLAREQIVFCNTHTHSGPDLFANLMNIFAVPMTTVEQQNAIKYRESLEIAIVDAVKQSLAHMQPVSVAHAQGTASFAANRRLVKDGRWTGFGIQPAAPVDHSVPVLCLKDAAGKIVGLAFNYACHCTTVDGNYYKVNADWAGIAAETLESEFAGAVALCTIGCGGDANPEPRGNEQLAAQHGATLAAEVKRLVQASMKSLDAAVDAHFGYAGLSFELPSKAELQERAKSTSPQTKRNAEYLLDLWEREGRLPATYPVPIQTWKFGDQLTMIFLGGEVVVDYALRLKKELDNPNLWVSAYSNDVLGYICSQRMRTEQGYEFRESGIFYNLPGPWASGTEDLLIERVKETLNAPKQAGPLSPQQGLQSIVVPEDVEVQLVASEPLVADPINIAFGHDGKLWVVEMGDYPNENPDGKPLGKINFLTDTDADGDFDSVTTFLDGIAFATAVHPWKDGVIVAAAPEVFFARDTNGDGVADERKTLYSGFVLANPQHRINGFAYGFDHSLHMAAGDNLGEIKCHLTGETINASGCDIKIFPDTGKLELVSGRTQFIRSRDDWGNWFGNDNSRPMYHYPIEERYLRRVPSLHVDDNMQQLFEPAVAPPVYPISATPDRFNDLFAHNRFTSACSAIIFSSPMLGDDRNGSAFICEPVHNLVHNAKIEPVGSTFKATRFPGQEQSEFFASTDPWCRPVRAVSGPDGMLWVVDMYRLVIEHPEWIPAAWQQQLDVRAGSDRGRIYRVIPKKLADANARKPANLPVIDKKSNDELVELLKSSYGYLRDMAQQQLLNRDEAWRFSEPLRALLAQELSPQTRIHALWTLAYNNGVNDRILQTALANKHPGVVCNALKLLEDRYSSVAVSGLDMERVTDPSIALQVALSFGAIDADSKPGNLLSLKLQMMTKHLGDNQWLRLAMLTCADKYADKISDVILYRIKMHAENASDDLELLGRIINLDGANRDQILAAVSKEIDSIGQGPLQFLLVETILNSKLAESSNSNAELVRTRMQKVYERALELSADQTVKPQDRVDMLRLLGRGLGDAALEQKRLLDCLAPQQPAVVQLAAAEQLTRHFELAAVEGLFENWQSFTQPVRQRVIDRMLRSGERMNILLNKIESGQIGRSDIPIASQQQLLQFYDHSIRARAARLLAVEESGDRRQLIQDYLDNTDGNGDRYQGEAHFKRLCASCHTPDVKGRSVGPNLSNLTDRGRTNLLTAILDPNRAVDPQYRNYLILTNGGETFSGAIAQEIGNTITLALTNGQFASVQRSDIEEIKNTGMSLMPEGLNRELNHQQATDLIEYLRQLK